MTQPNRDRTAEQNEVTSRLGTGWKFEAGTCVATPAAITALEEAGQGFAPLLARHLSGDWGSVDAEDQRTNDQAVKHGYRILSAYELSTGVKVWIITEADRSVTTLLLPDDY